MAVMVRHDCPQDDPAHTGSIAKSVGSQESLSSYVNQRVLGPSIR